MGWDDAAEETRESLFPWKRANVDLSGMLAGWRHRMLPVLERKPDGDDGAAYWIFQRFQRPHYGRSSTDDTGIDDLRQGGMDHRCRGRRRNLVELVVRLFLASSPQVFQHLFDLLKPHVPDVTVES